LFIAGRAGNAINTKLRKSAFTPENIKPNKLIAQSFMAGAIEKCVDLYAVHGVTIK